MMSTGHKLFIAITLFVIMLCSTLKVSAMTDTERKAIIAQIQAQIAALTQQLNSMLAEQQGATTAATTWCHTFDTNLGYANSGTAEVYYLHLALDKEGISYRPDNVGTYSTATAKAVSIFQSVHKISATGYVGKQTRLALNTKYGCQNENQTETQVETQPQPQENENQTETQVETQPQPQIQDEIEVITETCIANWSCTSWSTCTNNQQNRTCTDVNRCGTTLGKPTTSQSCSGISKVCVKESTAVGAKMWKSLVMSDDGKKIAAIGNDTNYSGTLYAYYYGYIYTSDDGGANWTKRTNAGFRIWESLVVSADGTTLAATYFSEDEKNYYLEVSHDGGVTWAKMTNSGALKSIAISADGSKMVGSKWGPSHEQSTIYLSKDSGSVWTQMHIGTGAMAAELLLSADGNKIVSINYMSGISYLEISNDEGKSWWDAKKNLTKGTVSVVLGSIAMSNDGTRLAFCSNHSADFYTKNSFKFSNPQIYFSNDGGLTWAIKRSSGLVTCSALAMSDDGTKMVVAGGSSAAPRIYFSNDGGDSWALKLSRECENPVMSDDGSKIVCNDNKYIYTMEQDSTCQACVPNCSGKNCGSDGCGGSCGTCSGKNSICNSVGVCAQCVLSYDCSSGQSCNNGVCAKCVPNCSGKNCGSDGCGGYCGSCFGGQACGDDGNCKTITDSSCTGVTCPAGQICSNGLCGDCYTIGAACYYKNDGYKSCPAGYKDLGSVGCTGGGGGKCCKCVPNCSGKNCGSDGCGGYCGTNYNGKCPSSQTCNDGVCSASGEDQEVTPKKEYYSCYDTCPDCVGEGKATSLMFPCCPGWVHVFDNHTNWSATCQKMNKGVNCTDAGQVSDFPEKGSFSCCPGLIFDSATGKCQNPLPAQNCVGEGKTTTEKPCCPGLSFYPKFNYSTSSLAYIGFGVCVDANNPKCGDGMCQMWHGENPTTCSLDCPKLYFNCTPEGAYSSKLSTACCTGLIQGKNSSGAITCTRPLMICGDGTCNNGESTQTCPQDCGHCIADTNLFYLPAQLPCCFGLLFYPSTDGKSGQCAIPGSIVEYKAPTYPNCNSFNDCKIGESCISDKCTKDLVYPQCNRNEECKTGEVCMTNGRCGVFCKLDSDCPSGQTCHIYSNSLNSPLGVCSTEFKCNTAEDCGSNKYLACVDQYCFWQCKQDADCNPPKPYLLPEFEKYYGGKCDLLPSEVGSWSICKKPVCWNNKCERNLGEDSYNCPRDCGQPESSFLDIIQNQLASISSAVANLFTQLKSIIIK